MMSEGLAFLLCSLLLANPADFYFLQPCNDGGSCVNEKWSNKTHWKVTCTEWMELEEGVKDKCTKPWKCCHTTQYDKLIPFP